MKLDLDQKLASACKLNQLDEVKNLISNGANIDSPDIDGITPLMWAIMGENPEALGSLDIVNFLIQNNVDLNKAEKNKMTALHMSAVTGQTKITNSLINAGADVNKLNSRGFTALFMALSFSYQHQNELERGLKGEALLINATFDRNYDLESLKKILQEVGLGGNNTAQLKSTISRLSKSGQPYALEALNSLTKLTTFGSSFIPQ